MCSSALGIRLSRSGKRSAATGLSGFIATPKQKSRPKAAEKLTVQTLRPEGAERCSPESVAGNFAFHALDVGFQAAQKLVVGDHILGDQHFAGVVHDRAFPDGKAAVLQAGLCLLY